MQFLRQSGIGCAVYYPIPLHLQTCFAHLGYREGDFPESERACREVLSLPIYAELPEEHQQRVVRKLAEAVQAESTLSFPGTADGDRRAA